MSELLTGSVAMIVATIAIAAFGLSMLAGRIDVRRGIAALVGCFVLLSASSIASGLRGSVADSAKTGSSAAISPPTVVKASPPPYDPYAGASLGPR